MIILKCGIALYESHSENIGVETSDSQGREFKDLIKNITVTAKNTPLCMRGFMKMHYTHMGSSKVIIMS